MKSGQLIFLEPSGPLQVCNGTALPLPLLVLQMRVSTFNPNTTHGHSTQVQKTKSNNHHSYCSLFRTPGALFQWPNIRYRSSFIEMSLLTSDLDFFISQVMQYSGARQQSSQAKQVELPGSRFVQPSPNLLKFSCAKIKTQPKVTPLNSLYPVGSSESYFFPPTHFHTPTPHPSSSSWLFFRASFGREERTGEGGGAGGNWDEGRQRKITSTEER